ncbi:hypothetical protein S40293_01720 [Stachybotrys chartarum IBT 40293]|nr:hypothetical protein S40293_01720 [Stachybotrys chartarum IBT 40293]
MQLQGLMGLLRLAETNPESSVRQIEMTEIMDRGTKTDVWYAGKVPNFRFLAQDELPKGALYGMKYKTVVLTPTKFLTWLYERLVAKGVQFRRTRVYSLAELNGLGHDRLQCVVAKASTTYDRLFIRRGDRGYYSTAFSRLDGTVYVGGVHTENDRDLSISDEQRARICKNAHDNQPDVFPSPDPKDWPILYDHVGVYATMDRKSGVRCEKEIVDGQRVVHAYRQNAGGYVYSFGLASEVVKLTEDYLLELPATGRL